jgi:hypothetical protein
MTSNSTIPLPFHDDIGHDDSDDAATMALVNHRREARERETILVHTIVTGIAKPLAKAFKGMPETGLLTTRYQLYHDTCSMVLGNDNVIPFMHHDIKVPDLLDNIWRTTEAGS